MSSSIVINLLSLLLTCSQDIDRPAIRVERSDAPTEHESSKSVWKSLSSTGVIQTQNEDGKYDLDAAQADHDDEEVYCKKNKNNNTHTK